MQTIKYRLRTFLTRQEWENNDVSTKEILWVMKKSLDNFFQNKIEIHTNGITCHFTEMKFEFNIVLKENITS